MKADWLVVLLCGLIISITSSVLAETPSNNPRHGQNLYQQHCLKMPWREVGWEWTGCGLTSLTAYQPSHVPHVG